MAFHWSWREHLALGNHILRWFLRVIPVAFIIGSACAFFLWALDVVTTMRWEEPLLLFLLPVAGILVAVIYHKFGKSIEGGNNLIVDEIHEPSAGIPSRMAPIVLLSTIVTHLFGGSSGREGTAIQMGGSIASFFTPILKLDSTKARILLSAGVAAGFGAVFGTPLTGAIFAVEVLAIGKIEYDAIIPCLMASIIGDLTCRMWGIHHTQYHITTQLFHGLTNSFFQIEWILLVKVALAAILFGLTSAFFVELTHSLGNTFKSYIKKPWLRPVIGGILIIGLVYLLGTRDYLGLGVSGQYANSVSIESAFHTGGTTSLSWFWKILFTAITLGSGFKGGEVTPLFFIGATLGNVLAIIFQAPVDIFAGIGFVAVFAGATNTPLACTIMSVELFGSEYLLYFAVACYLAYFFSGHSGIYLSQRVALSKGNLLNIPEDIPLKSIRASRTKNDRTDSFQKDDFISINQLSQLQDTIMAKHSVHSKETGLLRIFVLPRERKKSKGFMDKIKSKAVYQEIIDQAHTFGIVSAVAHNSAYGFSAGQKVENNMHEYPNTNLTMCVDLISERELLEEFCKTHESLLQGKLIVYKHIEHWEIKSHHLKEDEFTSEEMEGQAEIL